MANSNEEQLNKTFSEFQKINNTCSFNNCKSKVKIFAITCRFCNAQFCATHSLPEIHGCGNAVRNDERRKFLHPLPKQSVETHEKAVTKLHLKLRQKELERKAKSIAKTSKTK